MAIDAEDRESDEWWCKVEKLAQYYRFGSASGYKGIHNACEKDTFNVSFDPVKAIPLYKAIANGAEGYSAKEAVEALGPCFPSDDDAVLSYCWAKNAVEEVGEDYKYRSQIWQWYGCPYSTLAWHYFYGVCCEKNVEEAKRLMRWTCTENGEYWYPAYKKLIRDMGLDNELTYNPKLGDSEDE